MGISVQLDRPGTVSVQGNALAFTDKDVFVYVYINDVQVGPPFYSSVTNAWANIPFFVMRNLPAGTHTITLRANSNGSNARIASRVITAMAF